MPINNAKFKKISIDFYMRWVVLCNVVVTNFRRNKVYGQENVKVGDICLVCEHLNV